MKASILLLAALSAPLFVQADPIPGSQSNVTLSLTATHSETILDNATNLTEKLVSSRYGNRELLTDLLAEGFLPDTTISGWKLVVVDRAPLASDDGDLLVFYVIKAGQTPVELPASRLGIDVNSSAGAEAHTRKFAGEQVVSASSKFKAIVGFSGHQVLDSEDDSYDDTFNLTAIANGASATKVIKLKRDSILYSFTYDLLGAVKFSPIIGTLTDNLGQDDKRPIEGSITFSAFTPVDITAYPYTQGE